MRIDEGGDLVALPALDQKLWTALACPIRGVEFDARTLELLDLERDGRIRAPEVLAAVQWATERVADPSVLLAGGAALPLSAIDSTKEPGVNVLATARRILTRFGRPKADALTVADAESALRILAEASHNGDGVVPPEAVEAPEVAAAIRDVMATVGSAPDRSGRPGVDGALVERFFADAAAFDAWLARAESDPARLRPFGEGTADAANAFRAVKAKIADFFLRGRLAAFVPESAPALNPDAARMTALAGETLAAASPELRDLPVARAAPGAALPLGAGVNPAWAAEIARFEEAVVRPMFGSRDSITEPEFEAIAARLDPYEEWQAARAGASVEPLGAERVRELLRGDLRAKIDAELEADRSLAGEAAAIEDVERLVRLHRDLVPLLNNFVTFRDFYGRVGKSMFQAGTLYIDQRSCDLVVWVHDAAAHARLAGLARMCLVYCEVARPASGEKAMIAAAVTGGDGDNLMVGRNGLFYDRKGRDWDATITQIIQNPISVREAFFSPYKRFVRFIEEQVAKRAAAAEAEQTKKMEATAGAVATADKKPVELPKKVDVGAVAAMGVAVGAIGGALAAITTGLLGLAAWQIPLVVIAVILLISGPSMLIAALKLRQRNLGPILDANGWAVNARAKISLPFGRHLTQIAKRPPGAKIDRRDPWKRKKRPIHYVIAIVAALIAFAAVFGALWYFGVLHKYLPSLVEGWLRPPPARGG